ncbi:hypothetical protein FSP39_004630 [Pinctada imbricata]|uniref:VWFA domain-containing protein n=1 Tax=Pinctada imbricata TaxID=66713 RepID=A0AA88Y5F5_PINIB|nr:hypothetical protein FSP39_004630 [Pinctada imbricata]
MLYRTLLVLLLTYSAACQKDLTTQKGSKGSDVVEAVLDRIRSRCIFRDDRLFMRRLAIVSSEDGNDPNYDKDTSGGIWKIPRSSFESTLISHKLASFKDNILQTFGIHWNAITYESLDIPLLSGLATHMMIENIGKDIKADSTEQADYWALHWKIGADVKEFTSKINALQKPRCSKPVDLVFAMDESGSVGSYNFERMKQFLSNLTEELAIGYNGFKVGAVKFNSRGTEVFQLDTYQTKSDIQASIVFNLKDEKFRLSITFEEQNVGS